MPVDLRGLLSDRKMNEKICRIQLSMTAPTTTRLVGYFQLCLLLSLTAFIRRLFCFIIMLLLIFFFFTDLKQGKKCLKGATLKQTAGGTGRDSDRLRKLNPRKKLM